MSGTITVHQCLFCPRTFDSATAKDDHILEHFSQETCGECDQRLIQIGGRLFTLHDTVTCIKRELKTECCSPASMTTNQPLAPDQCHLRFDGVNYEDKFAADVAGSKSICTEEIVIKVEPLDVEYSQQLDDPFHEEQVQSVNQTNEISGTNVAQSGNYSLIDENITRFKCSDCNETFYSKARLGEHKRQNHDPTFEKFPCKYCKNVLRSESSLEMHYKHCVRKRKQESERDRQCVVQNLPSPFRSSSKLTLVDCTVCGKIYKKRDLSSHMRLNHDPNCRKYICKYCRCVILSKSALEIHFKNCKRKAKLEIECSKNVDVADEMVVSSDSTVQHEQQQDLESQNSQNMDAHTSKWRECKKTIVHQDNHFVVEKGSKTDCSLIQEMNIKREPETMIKTPEDVEQNEMEN